MRLLKSVAAPRPSFARPQKVLEAQRQATANGSLPFCSACSAPALFSAPALVEKYHNFPMFS